MFDHTAQPFLGMLTRACHTRAGELGRRVHVFVENADNDPRLMKPSRLGGFDVDAAWNDDFHHALHVTLTGESEGYYTDFAGGPADLATAIDAGYVVAGKYSPFRERRHGASSADLPRSSLVVFGQNHDQVGNRSRGDRLSTLADPARLRLAAALVLLSPWVPLLFMGEEWAEVRPFLYFVDHSDPTLLDGVRRGRAEEFADLVGQGERLPDPASPDTRHRSVLDWASISSPTHAAVLDLYTTLIHIRKTHPSITDPRPETHHVTRDGTLVTLLGDGARPATVSLFNVGETVATVALPPSRWRRRRRPTQGRSGAGRQPSSPVGFRPLRRGLRIRLAASHPGTASPGMVARRQGYRWPSPPPPSAPARSTKASWPRFAAAGSPH
jgi:maltooligosyltrehalose trehalohydrolase